MAKYRHRIFEMYEFRDEATRALTPKSARPVTEATAPESWTFKHLAVSRSASVAHVQFKRAQAFGEETVSDLRVDFSQLADKLVRDSKVLLDFAGVKSFWRCRHRRAYPIQPETANQGQQDCTVLSRPYGPQSFFSKSNGHREKNEPTNAGRPVRG